MSRTETFFQALRSLCGYEPNRCGICTMPIVCGQEFFETEASEIHTSVSPGATGKVRVLCHITCLHEEYAH